MLKSIKLRITRCVLADWSPPTTKILVSNHSIIFDLIKKKPTMDHLKMTTLPPNPPPPRSSSSVAKVAPMRQTKTRAKLKLHGHGTKSRGYLNVILYLLHIPSIIFYIVEGFLLSRGAEKLTS